jgi:hypothetical protein
VLDVLNRKHANIPYQIRDCIASDICDTILMSERPIHNSYARRVPAKEEEKFPSPLPLKRQPRVQPPVVEMTKKDITRKNIVSPSRIRTRLTISPPVVPTITTPTTTTPGKSAADDFVFVE